MAVWCSNGGTVSQTGACKGVAKRLRFHSHSPEHYQLVAYEHWRAEAHRRTRLAIAAALGVGITSHGDLLTS